MAAVVVPGLSIEAPRVSEEFPEGIHGPSSFTEKSATLYATSDATSHFEMRWAEIEFATKVTLR